VVGKEFGSVSRSVKATVWARARQQHITFRDNERLFVQQRITVISTHSFRNFFDLECKNRILPVDQS
jgi:hypothetical protein